MSIDLTVTYDNNTITSLTKQTSVAVTYDNNTIATITAPGTKTLACNNKMMKSNVGIGSKTLSCANKVMKSNVVITTINTPFEIAFTLVANSTTYTFDQNTATKSVSNVYSYARNGEDWDLIIYSGGSIKFTTLNTNVDICCVGGGGGGSSGSWWSNPSYAWGAGGNGGGGSYTTSNQALTLNTAYTTTIGSGGARGVANVSAGTVHAGSAGGTTKFGSLVSATGGGGGKLPTRATSGSYAVTDGATGSPNTSSRYVFGSSSSASGITYPSVCGANRNSYRGGGGKGGTGYYNGANSGTAGAAGLIVIRNHR